MIQNNEKSDEDKLESKSENTNSKNNSDIKFNQLQMIESYVENFMSTYTETDQKTFISSSNNSINIKQLLIETLTNFIKKANNTPLSSIYNAAPPNIVPEKNISKPQFQTFPKQFEGTSQKNGEPDPQNKLNNPLLFQLYNQNTAQSNYPVLKNQQNSLIQQLQQIQAVSPGVGRNGSSNLNNSNGNSMNSGLGLPESINIEYPSSNSGLCNNQNGSDGTSNSNGNNMNGYNCSNTGGS